MTSKAKTNVQDRHGRPTESPNETRYPSTGTYPGVSANDERTFVPPSSSMMIGYMRVSTPDQVTLRQQAELESICDRVFVDHGVSGTKRSRPQLDEMLGVLRTGDTVVITELSRLSRSTRHTLELMERFRANGIGLHITSLGIDTRTAAGQLVATVIAAIYEMQIAELRESTRAGLAAARAQGRVGGRRPSLGAEQQTEVRRMHAEGRTSGEIARLFGVSDRTVRRTVAGVTD